MVSFFENIQAEQGATVTPGTTSDTDTTISPINFTRTSAVVSGCVFRKPVGAPIASSLGRFCYGVPIHGWMPSNAQYQKKCHMSYSGQIRARVLQHFRANLALWHVTHLRRYNTITSSSLAERSSVRSSTCSGMNNSRPSLFVLLPQSLVPLLHVLGRVVTRLDHHRAKRCERGLPANEREKCNMCSGVRAISPCRSDEW